MKVAIVHDDLVQWGGAERVLEGICEIFPDAPIFTSLYDQDNLKVSQLFGSKKIITSFLQKIPGWKNFYKGLLPFYPIAFEQFDFTNYDLVISHTTRFAKSVITKPSTKHICYIHTPPRFLWSFSKERLPRGLGLLLSYLRIYDAISARKVDKFLAGSENAKQRIKKVYKKDSEVLYPFVDLNRFKRIESFNGGYYLVISRLNFYKRVDLVVLACLKLGVKLKVIGMGPELERLKRLAKNSPLIEFLGGVDDEILSLLLAGAKALIVPGEEDFGLTPLEAQALGKPVIAFGKGGVLETVINGITGIFFYSQEIDDLSSTLLKFDKRYFDPDECVENARRFSKKSFISNFKQTLDNL